VTKPLEGQAEEIKAKWLERRESQRLEALASIKGL
jgi:hypothetical protein